MRLPKSVLAALAGVSLVFVSACASPDDQTAENTNTQETEVAQDNTVQATETATAPEETETAEPETGDTEDGNAETDDAESGSTNEPLASKDVSYNGEDLTVDVLSVRDDGSLTTVDVRITNNGDSKFQIANFFHDGDNSVPGTDQNDPLLYQSARGIHLIDTANDKIHRTAFDSAGNCLCTTGLSSTFIEEGESHTLYTSVASIPDGVDEVSVVIPNVGSLPKVPVTRD